MWFFVSGFFCRKFLRFHPCCNIYQYFISVYCLIILHCRGIPHFICLFISLWTLRLFLLLDYYVAMNIHVQVFVGTYVFNSLGLYLGMELLSHMGILYLLNFLRNCQPIFQSGYAILHSHMVCTRVQFLHILAKTYYCLSFLL